MDKLVLQQVPYSQAQLLAKVLNVRKKARKSLDQNLTVDNDEHDVKMVAGKSGCSHFLFPSEDEATDVITDLTARMVKGATFSSNTRDVDIRNVWAGENLEDTKLFSTVAGYAGLLAIMHEKAHWREAK